MVFPDGRRNHRPFCGHCFNLFTHDFSIPSRNGFQEMFLPDIINGHIFGIFHKLSQILGWFQIMPWDFLHQLLGLLSYGGAVLKFQIANKVLPILECIVAVQVRINLGVQFNLENGLHPGKHVFWLNHSHSCICCLYSSDPD